MTSKIRVSLATRRHNLRRAANLDRLRNSGAARVLGSSAQIVANADFEHVAAGLADAEYPRMDLDASPKRADIHPRVDRCGEAS
jgi:hypothetical protein